MNNLKKYGNIRLRSEYLHKLKNDNKLIFEIATQNNMSFLTVLNWVNSNAIYLTTELNLSIIRKGLKVANNDKITMDLSDTNLKIDLD
jgi:hypothetical protein